MSSVLHVIPHLSGGAGRSLLNLIRYARGPYQHTVMPLRGVEAQEQERLRRDGVALLDADGADGAAALAAADIVQVHYWNTPAMWGWLQSDLPPLRLLLWPQIGGRYAPQVLTPALVAAADLLVVSSQYSAGLPVFGANKPPVIYSMADLSRCGGVARREHEGFNVGYIGTCAPTKMHPHFVALCAGIDVPEARFIVCGSQLDGRRMRREAAALGLDGRLDLRGYVEDLGSLLAEMDVFGYPLCADNYSSSELVLQEVMYAGIPPVVLDSGGAASLIRHGVTGYVAANEEEYCQAIEYLAGRPDERRRLGAAAHEYAAAHFQPEASAARFQEHYDALLRRPKRAHRELLTLNGEALRGAALFAFALGEAGAAFKASLAGDEAAMLEAEQDIGGATAVLCNHGAGGIFHYRNAFPDDAYLRLWAGLALLGQGQRARALSELAASREFGLEHWRVGWYMARAAAGLGAVAAAREELRRVLEQAPHFRPAQALAAELGAGAAA